jgi:hypothetical protein
MSRTATQRCPDCGRPLDDHQQAVRFTLPDPVLDCPDWEERPDTWLSGDDAWSSSFLTVPAVGSFIRSTLPVRLSGGHQLEFGVWIAASPAVLEHAWAVWDAPEYASLAVDGRLANGLPGWDVLGAPVTATVRSADELPYCTASPHAELAAVLTREWPHADVLPRLEMFRS